MASRQSVALLSRSRPKRECERECVIVRVSMRCACAMGADPGLQASFSPARVA